MLTRRELKAHAREQLRGNIGILFLCNMIVIAIPMIAVKSVALGFLSVFLMMPVSIGLCRNYLNVTYGQRPQVAALFSCFPQFGQIALAQILKFLILLPMGVIVYIPLGIFIFLRLPGSVFPILLYSLWMIYAFALIYYVELGLLMMEYILAEHPQLSATKVVKASWRMMKGNRWKFLVLNLSFIPWLLLGLLTFGIVLVVYVAPYMRLTLANFYHSIKGSEFPDVEEGYSPAEGGFYSLARDDGEEGGPVVRDEAYVIEAYVPETWEAPVIERDVPVPEEIAPAAEEAVPAVEEADPPAKEADDEDQEEEWSWDLL